MRKRISFSHFSRTSSHYHAMMKNMCMSLIEHERIITTEPKAKAMRKIAENVRFLESERYSLSLILGISRNNPEVNVKHAIILSHDQSVYRLLDTQRNGQSASRLLMISWKLDFLKLPKRYFMSLQLEWRTRIRGGWGMELKSRRLSSRMFMMRKT